VTIQGTRCVALTGQANEVDESISVEDREQRVLRLLVLSDHDQQSHEENDCVTVRSAILGSDTPNSLPWLERRRLYRSISFHRADTCATGRQGITEGAGDCWSAMDVFSNSRCSRGNENLHSTFPTNTRTAMKEQT
jgi:hypothetical protein